MDVLSTGTLAQTVAEHTGSAPTEQGKVARLRTRVLSLLQLRTNFQQLIIAMTASAQALQRLQQEMAELVSSAEGLVQSMASVPKHEILPIFHKTGQLLEVRVKSDRALLCRLHVFSPLVGL
jgi:hypothetical protein